MEKEEAKQELIEEKTYPVDLQSLLMETTWSLKSFCKLLDNAGEEDEEHNEILQVLSPLIEHQQATFEKIAAVISGTLGDIRILVCDDPMRVDDTLYGPGAFYKVALEPKEALASVQRAE